MFATWPLVCGKNSLYRQLSSDSKNYSNIYSINSKDSRLWSMIRSLDSLTENLKKLYCSHSVTQRCANCARKVSDVRGENLRKSEIESVCVCVCVLKALPVTKPKNKNQCYKVTVLQELLNTKIQLWKNLLLPHGSKLNLDRTARQGKIKQKLYTKYCASHRHQNYWKIRSSSQHMVKEIHRNNPPHANKTENKETPLAMRHSADPRYSTSIRFNDMSMCWQMHISKGFYCYSLYFRTSTIYCTVPILFLYTFLTTSNYSYTDSTIL